MLLNGMISSAPEIWPGPIRKHGPRPASSCILLRFVLVQHRSFMPSDGQEQDATAAKALRTLSQAEERAAPSRVAACGSDFVESRPPSSTGKDEAPSRHGRALLCGRLRSSTLSPCLSAIMRCPSTSTPYAVTPTLAHRLDRSRLGAQVPSRAKLRREAPQALYMGFPSVPLLFFSLFSPALRCLLAHRTHCPERCAPLHQYLIAPFQSRYTGTTPQPPLTYLLPTWSLRTSLRWL